jgi:hypothetical protein
MLVPGDISACLLLLDVRDDDATPPPGVDGVLCRPDAAVAGGLLRAVPASEPMPDADLLWLDGDEITNQPLIEACALSGLPLALSSAGATLPEVTRAIGWHQLAFRHGAIPADPGRVRFQGAGRILVVHEPPARPNLRALARISERSMGPVGYKGPPEHAALALAAGASLIVLTPHAGVGADIKAIREAEATLGQPRLEPLPGPGRRGVVAARDLPRGHVLAAGDLAFQAGGEVEDGFRPYQAEGMHGRAIKRPVKADEAILRDDLEGAEPEPPPWFSPRPPSTPPG